MWWTLANFQLNIFGCWVYPGFQCHLHSTLLDSMCMTNYFSRKGKAWDHILFQMNSNLFFFFSRLHAEHGAHCGS